MNYLANATSTIRSNSAYAFTFATTTTAVPLLRLNTTTNNEQVIFGGDVLVGTVGKSSNLIFEESATISGQGANTLTFGQTGDIINFAVKTGFGSTSPYSLLSLQGSSRANLPTLYDSK